MAASAYRSASQMVDERTGEVFDFTRKEGVLSSEIVAPSGVPVPERSDLWNAAESAEKRKDARVAREWRAALPHELDDAGRRELATRMAKSIAERYGVAVDVCIHAPDKGGDERNYHVHILATTRTINADGTLGVKSVIELANKDRQKAGIPGTSQGDIADIRREWAELANAALERAGISARIDHRSYASQGVDLTPTKHIGSDAVAMSRRGLEADRIDIHNADRQEQARQIGERPEIILDKITATRAVFTRRDIATELNRYIDDASQFQSLLAKLENSPLLVELEADTGREPAKFSTREMIDAERAMVESAERLFKAGKHSVSERVMSAAIDGAGTLSDEQKNAVRHALQPGSLAVVIGDAGTGKSFSMKVAREAWQAQGFNVIGAALAGKAADELQAGSGIESRTLASLEFAWKNGKDTLTGRDVLVIDEAGMIGSRQLGRVLKAAEQAGAKVVLLGDDKQLAAIEAGAAFRGVVQRVGAAEITEVRRQKEAWARAAGQQFARGSVAEGLAAYAERGHVKIHDSRESARDALAVAYVGDQGKGSQIILAHSNADVQALNVAVRDARKERGELAGSAHFGTERGSREFAAGDRVVFLKNDRDLGVKNGTLGTVERAENGSLAVRLDSGESRQVQASQYAAVDHGYAVTIHKAQGVTVDRAYLLATPGMDRSLAYVGMTRHREAVTLFAGAELAGGKLAQVMGRERAKESTLDFADRRGFDGESVVRRWMERGRAKVAELADQMQRAMRQTLARHGRPDLMPATDIAGTPVVQRPQPVERTAEDDRARRTQEIAEKIRQKLAHDRGELAASQPPRQVDALAGFRAGVERAEAAGGGLALDVAKAQLVVAQEFQMAGKDPRHHLASIMQEGQQRAFAGLAQPTHAKAELERPAVAQVSEQDRKRAEMYAKRETEQFKVLAVKRQAGFAGYTDRNPSAWRELSADLRERIERFNSMPKERQTIELDKMQRELADRYARDPKEIERSRQRQREQERGNGGWSR